jgi:hypothetical protein
MSYTIIVHNNQGASDVYRGETQGEINRWLNGWSDSENLSATVENETGIIATKEMGKKRLTWHTKNESAAALGRKGGSVTTKAKKKSSAANGKLGGRPKSKDKGAN